MDNKEVKANIEQKDEPGIWVKLPGNDYFFCDKCGERSRRHGMTQTDAGASASASHKEVK